MSLVKLVPVGRCCKRPCFLSRESVVGTQACIRLSCCGLCRVRLLVPTASHVRGIFGVPQRKTTPSASIRLCFFLSDLIDLHLFSRLASLTSTRLLCQTQHTDTVIVSRISEGRLQPFSVACGTSCGLSCAAFLILGQMPSRPHSGVRIPEGR